MEGKRTRTLIRGAVAVVLLCAALPLSHARARVIEITADHDSRYRIAGESKPVITVFAGEELLLRITAKKANTQNRDGSVHGFTLLRAKDRSKVPGWDFLLQPGVQEIALQAPAEPGEYQVVCTVICSQDHEGMHMKFVVLPSGQRVIRTSSQLSSGSGSTGTFVGEIADTQCALNVHSLHHSHEEMIKAKRMGTDAASCASYCVRNMGGSFVLLHDKKIVYRLDDQVRAEAFAGQKVLVQGSLDPRTNTIQVSSISAAK